MLFFFITTRFSLPVQNAQTHFHFSVNYKRLSNVLFEKDAAIEAEAERNKSGKKQPAARAHANPFA